MEPRSAVSTDGRIKPTVRQAVAGNPTTMDFPASRHSAGESTVSGFPLDMDFQSLHEGSASGIKKLEAVMLIFIPQIWPCNSTNRHPVVSQ
jgi:hypothetical protein